MTPSITFSPLIFWPALVALAILGIFFALLAFRRRVYWARAVFLWLLCFILCGPSLVQETRKPLSGKVVIVVDDSASMNLEDRRAQSTAALAQIEQKLKEQGIDPVIAHASSGDDSTKLFAALSQAAEAVPSGQGAGVVFITDGEVHDVPESLPEKLGPLNVALAGASTAYDRRVTITEAPKYGILHQEITVTVTADEEGDAPVGTPALTLRTRQDDSDEREYPAVAGKAQSFTFTLTHPGQNVFRFFVPAATGELTTANNTGAVVINAVRDRLRVLLVTGRPYEGGRAWRNLLKSDPAIDLVHFTILRSPFSMDPAPSREMALIPFPVDELFEKKIRDFDLIIFDKYSQGGYDLLQQRYFANIASFVQDGGAFMAMIGPEAPTNPVMPGEEGQGTAAGKGLFDTPLASILPVSSLRSPLSSIPFRPALTEAGKTHPITQDLSLQASKVPSFGRWLSQLSTSAKADSKTLLTGTNDMPLLTIGEAGKGRVAALTSEDAWMWEKGVDGGGPYALLMRNIAHWLMKEPELEEGYIKAEAAGDAIAVSARKQEGGNTVEMTDPSGGQQDIELKEGKSGWMIARVPAAASGLYSFSTGTHSAFVAIGGGEGEEFRRMTATEERLRPIVKKTGGDISWLEKEKDFTPKLRKTKAYSVEGQKTSPLLPPWLELLVLLGSAFFVWWRESRVRERL